MTRSDETRRPAAVAARDTDDHTTRQPLSLGRSGDFHVMLVDEGGTPRCDRWSNDADAHRLGVVLGGEHVTLGYEVQDAHTIVVNELIRASSPDALRCYWKIGAQLASHATGDLVLEGGARWFRNAADCAAAIAGREKVATLLPCRLARLASPVSPIAREASWKRFQSLLHRGGTMFMFGESELSGCTAVTIKSRTKKVVEGSSSLRYTNVIEGSFSLRYANRTYKPELEQGTVAYGFSWKSGSDTMWIDGPEYTPDGQPEEAYARLCGSRTKLRASATGVELNEPGTLFFTEEQCRDGHARYDARARWLASKEPTTWACGAL